MILDWSKIIMINRENYQQYADKYFIRSKEILEKDNLNPWVRAQVFIRKGPGIFSYTDAVRFLKEFTDIEKNGGTIHVKENNTKYDASEVVMIIIARVQDIIDLETIYLGDISYYTTIASKEFVYERIGIESLCLNVLSNTYNNVKKIKNVIGDRDIIYMGARHWLWSKDKEIASIAFKAGVSETSTDIGASSVGKFGIGTIPHALENVYAWKFGQDRGVVEVTKAFDKHIDKDILRIALVDYNNKEIEDTLRVINEVDDLYGVRIDTCGENYIQDAYPGCDFDYEHGKFYFYLDHKRICINIDQLNFWFGRGVSITGVYKLAKMLNIYKIDRKIILSSGFGDINKVKAFVDAEEQLGMKLFDTLGVGNVFGLEDIRIATMDITHVGDDKENMKEIHKVGRMPKYNESLVKVL